MTFGPIDVLAVEVKGNHFKGEVLAEVLDLVQREIIRIIDIVVVVKDADGNVQSLELRELDPEFVEIFNPLNAEITSLISANDIEVIAASLDNDCSAAIFVYENIWAIRIKEAFQRLGARVVLQERIPGDVVEEELKDIAVLSSANG